MPTSLDQIDPEWAWRTYEPDAERPWNRRAAAHLFRRSGYGASSQQLDDALGQSPAAVVRELLTGGQRSVDFDRDMNRLGRTMLATGDAAKLAAWWLHRAIGTTDPLGDKLTLFWHGHFATSADKVTDTALMYEQHLTLRRHVLKRFEPLVHAISRDPAMLVYLDSVTNRKRHPNENFARELMELFCLGLDQYTEEDIREVARCFTGWEIRRRRFSFNEYQHDTGTKSFLGATGQFGGADAVRIVVGRPSCAEFITRKMIRYLVCDDTTIPDALVKPLADDFRGHDLDIARLVERILTSQLFFSDTSVGRKVRSPVDLAVGFLRSLEGTTNTVRLAQQVATVGQSLFHPPSVKGWDGGRDWINSATLLGRANLVSGVLRDENTRFAGGDLAQLCDRNDVPDERIVDWLLELLVAVPVGDVVRQRLIEMGKATAGDRSRRLSEIVYAIAMLPEFHLG